MWLYLHTWYTQIGFRPEDAVGDTIAEAANVVQWFGDVITVVTRLANIATFQVCKHIGSASTSFKYHFCSNPSSFRVPERSHLWPTICGTWKIKDPYNIRRSIIDKLGANINGSGCFKICITERAKFLKDYTKPGVLDSHKLDFSICVHSKHYLLENWISLFIG